jgi:tetratricopeptide (TPR) repeat protein
MWLGLVPQAEQALAQALALQPDLPFAQRGAVELSLQEGKYSQAVAQSRKLVEANPTDATALTAAGNAHLFAGNLEQARDRFERAYAISPEAQHLGRFVRVLLGYTLWKAGQRERAQKLFEEYRTVAQGELAKGSESPDFQL